MWSAGSGRDGIFNNRGMSSVESAHSNFYQVAGEVLRVRHVHFIGIGGYSMSGLGLLLHQQGIRVTGSDMNRSSRTDRLERAGVVVYQGHREANVGDADVVVYTTDVPTDNAERRWAETHGRQLWHRSDLLAYVLSGYRTLLVAGTHGKTTTSTMMGRILVEAGLDPTVLVGGEVEFFGGNVRQGEGQVAVAEADESDGTFLRYPVWVAVATNVEPEHLEHYHGSFEQLKDAFFQFLRRVPADGLAVLSAESPELQALRGNLIAAGIPLVTYGTGESAEVRAVRIVPWGPGTRFQVETGGETVAEVTLPIPGLHNLRNALAAMVACHHAGVPWAISASILGRFENAARRFQRIFDDRRILVVDDYAHHPSEIMATLQAARQVTEHRVLAVFQPQRYIRTRNLWDEFLHAFQSSDEVFLTEIYAPPGDTPLAGVSGEGLAQAMRSVHPGPIHFVADFRRLPAMLFARVRPGDCVITMGAGNIYQVAYALSNLLAAEQSG